MIGVALADLHLGFTAFSREIGGRNAREIDVEAAWKQAVENTVAEQPDLVTIAGDIFHHPRVSMHAVRAYRDGIRRIVQETDAQVVILQGNHDAVRSAGALSPLIIPEDYSRVHIILEPRRLSLTCGDEKVSVACFPFVRFAGEDVAFKVEPDPEADVNVLLVHAAVKESDDAIALPYFYGGVGALDVGREADRWDVIACGDYHQFHDLHPTRPVFYSGSIERTSSNIWQEWWPKGIVAFDTTAGSYRLIEHPTRGVAPYDLGDFNLPPGVGAEDVNRCLSNIAGVTDLEDQIVRFVVDAFPRHERESIDWSLVRELKSRLFHFQLDLKYSTKREVAVRDRREHPARSIDEEARAFFSNDPPAVREVAFAHLGIDSEPAEELSEPELVGGGV